MARSRRVTLRLEEKELAAITGFAEERHVIPSVALRWLIAMGLGEDRAGHDDCHTKQTSHGK
jgi:hypothetical protein